MIVAVIPLKRLSEAKSRLAGRLTAGERRELAVQLLERTVAAVRNSEQIDRVALATVEEDLAHRLGLIHLPDRGSLNASLLAGVEWATREGAQALLILPADLPLVDAADIATLCDDAPTSRGILVAPTNDGGTGALFLTPPDAMPPMFGPDSARRHMSLATTLGLELSVANRPGLAIDLDTWEDFDVALGTKKKIAYRVPRRQAIFPNRD